MEAVAICWPAHIWEATQQLVHPVVLGDTLAWMLLILRYPMIRAMESVAVQTFIAAQSGMCFSLFECCSINGRFLMLHDWKCGSVQWGGFVWSNERRILSSRPFYWRRVRFAITSIFSFGACCVLTSNTSCRACWGCYSCSKMEGEASIGYVNSRLSLFV